MAYVMIKGAKVPSFVLLRGSISELPKVCDISFHTFSHMLLNRICEKKKIYFYSIVFVDHLLKNSSEHVLISSQSLTQDPA